MISLIEQKERETIKKASAIMSQYGGNNDAGRKLGCL
jgi:hypothetical protein